ncbi:MAG TPA: winged helix-turn-helix domain-containing protein [Candidatus Paceibacterota bacterium]
MSVNFRKTERIIKGVANHRRLKILDLLRREPELSVDEIADKTKCGYMNASDHIRKLALAGLVMKRSDSTSVRHKLTALGEHILVFCKKLE